jgi:peptide-methionine (S)-S-oxide reductase
MSESKKLALATFGSGCFWCTEAVFNELRGVESVVSGYSGGQTADPTYEQVCSGRTGHAEVVQITYDANEVRFEELLEIFFKTHDPTTMNRQGHDVGTQYRSVIFYHDDEQRQAAESAIAKLNEVGVFGSPVVTQVVRFEKFYPAEGYHQNYFARNPDQAYCAAVIRPKIEKFRAAFRERL